MKRKRNGNATKHVYVTERVHRALNSIAARNGSTVNGYLEFLLMLREPAALLDADKAIKKEKDKKA